MTTPHHWPTHLSRIKSSCHLQTHGLAVDTTGLHNYRRPSPTPKPFNTGWKWPNCQSPASLMVWQSMIGLWKVMESLVTSTNEEVLNDAVPSNWVEISLPWWAEPAQWDHSHSRNSQAHPKGSLSMTHSERQPVPQTTTTAQMTTQTNLSEEVVLQQAESDSQPLTPPQEFAEIAWSLWGDCPPSVIISIPPEEAEDQDPFEIMGSSVMTACLFRHSVSGLMPLDILTCMLSIADMRLDPMANDHPIPALSEMMDSA